MPLPVIPPAGVSPASYFVAVLHEPPPGEPIGFLADAIDPQTGELLSIERGFDPTDAAVITAVRTQRESGSAVLDVGMRLAGQQRIATPLIPQFLREEARLALQHLVDAGEISLGALATLEGDTGNLYLEYQNLVRQRAGAQPLPLGRPI